MEAIQSEQFASSTATESTNPHPVLFWGTLILLLSDGVFWLYYTSLGVKNVSDPTTQDLWAQRTIT
jgi:threonine/homoserine/homoserine lactone efflux protein